MDRFCQNCGNKLSIDAKFCNKCGIKLFEVSREYLENNNEEGQVESATNNSSGVAENSGSSEMINNNNINNSNTNTNTNSNTNKNNGVIFAIIGIAFAVVVVIIVAILLIKTFTSKPITKLGEDDQQIETMDEEPNGNTWDDKDDKDAEKENDDKNSSASNGKSENANRSSKEVNELNRTDMSALFDILALSYDDGEYNSLTLLGGIANYSSFVGDYYEYEETSNYRIRMNKSDVEELLANTVGFVDFSYVGNDDGSYSYFEGDDICFCMPDTGDYFYEDQLESINELNDGTIELIGTKDCRYYTESWHKDVRIVLKPNENSIWDGYCVDYIDESAVEHYYLPDIEKRVYYADEMAFNEEEYRRARNEIFARYGRTFKTAELQAYFDQQHWYNGYREDVSTEELTETERQTLKELDKYKEMNGF